MAYPPPPNKKISWCSQSVPKETSNYHRRSQSAPKDERVCKFFSHAKKLEKTNFVANLRQKRNSNDLANPRRKRKSDHVVHLPKSALPILIDVVYLRQKGLRVFKFVAAPREEGKIKICSQSAPKEIIKWCSPPSPKVRTFNRVCGCLGQINSWKFEL